MIKVKTFGEPLEPFKTRRELDELDERVNAFIREGDIQKVISVSDTATTTMARPSVWYGCWYTRSSHHRAPGPGRKRGVRVGSLFPFRVGGGRDDGEEAHD